MKQGLEGRFTANVGEGILMTSKDEKYSNRLVTGFVRNIGPKTIVLSTEPLSRKPSITPFPKETKYYLKDFEEYTVTYSESCSKE
ncbi:MAG: hypothetical protein ACOCUU_01390 [Nanoarchaeota archaeon]